MVEAEEKNEGQDYYDDLSGKKLDAELVKIARKEELEEVKKHGVYEQVPIDECWKVTGKRPIGVRWVDVNKGDQIQPEVGSRLVAKVIKKHKNVDLFAPTLPVEANKSLFSAAVTEGVGYSRGGSTCKLDFIDVKRAYFPAEARRNVCVELPEEDKVDGTCGKRRKAMYGTRDAAQAWEYEYTDFMVARGFMRGVSTPCVFYHPEKRQRAVVHGYDFTILGIIRELDWFREKIEEKYEVKIRGRLGPDTYDDKSIRIRNRIVSWTAEGIEYEADQRHSEIRVRDLGPGVAKGISTPGVKWLLACICLESLHGSSEDSHRHTVCAAWSPTR